MYYLFVFIASLIVDIVPFIGPPAWTVMVFFQIKYGLDIWAVLVFGVAGSALGRYILSLYTRPLLGGLISEQKKQDMQFIGNKLSGNGWKIKLFVLLYTLVPIPSTPLFAAAGMAKISAKNLIPPFVLGKFASDMVMVLSGYYTAQSAMKITQGLTSWKSISGFISGILILFLFFCIDWRYLLQYKRLKFEFRIWKHK